MVADDRPAIGASPAYSGTTPSAVAGTTLWAVADHLGSARDLVDNNGIVRKHVVFDSFGKRSGEVNRDAGGTVLSALSASAVDTAFGYTGADWDGDVGLTNHDARWYDSGTGRWLSQDPIGFEAGDPNLYRYVGNTPVTKTDPSGLVPPEDLIEELEAMVDDPAAKEEARRIGQAIANTFANNSGWWRFPKIPLFGPDERNKRIFCYEWAWSFHDAFEHESSGDYFEARVESSITDDLRVHYWLRIRTEDKSQAIYVDDGFWVVDNETGERTYIHDSRPLGGKYRYDSGGPVSDKPRDSIWAPPFYDAEGHCRGRKPTPLPHRRVYDNSGWGQPMEFDSNQYPSDNSGWGYGGF